MELYPSKQEVGIIQFTSIIWTVWELYRDWDTTTKRVATIYNWFTSDPENDEHPQPEPAYDEEKLLGREACVAPTSSSNEKEHTSKDLEAALTLLKKKDDTSRFVGLALLKPVLEQQLSQIESVGNGSRTSLVQRCWAAIPIKFIDRLLKARANDNRSREEAQNMTGLAVAVLYAFMTLLEYPDKDDKLMGRVPLLRAMLRSCAPTTRPQVIGIFHMLVTTPAGALAVFHTAGGSDSDEKPDSYLFITMLLIDIRSTIPSLQENLHSEGYLETSERLAKAYDIVSAFIAFLVQSLETMSTNDETTTQFSSPMPVDLLLKLRTNISETMSLTIEHLRDRYDSSIAGAGGLHPSARAPDRSSSSTPLPITWDTSSGLFKDSLILPQLRTLSLWLRDEENDTLRMEAAGIMDVLLALYQHNGDQDFRSPVLVALEGILCTPEGMEAFLREDGWTPLSKDLQNCISRPSDQSLGIEIVRILLSVAESDLTGPPKEEWTQIVGLAMESQTTAELPGNELRIAVSQLAVEILTRAPRGMRKRCRGLVEALLKANRTLLGKEEVDGDDRDGVEEVVQGLELLDF